MFGEIRIGPITLDRACEHLLNGREIPFSHGFIELRKFSVQNIGRESRFVRLEDEGMIGSARIGVNQELFVKLFAGPKANIADLDVATRILLIANFEIGEVHHKARKFDNSNRVPHLQDKDLASACHSARLDYQFGCFRN